MYSAFVCAIVTSRPNPQLLLPTWPHFLMPINKISSYLILTVTLYPTF